jgi:hypothetical protein
MKQAWTLIVLGGVLSASVTSEASDRRAERERGQVSKSRIMLTSGRGVLADAAWAAPPPDPAFDVAMELIPQQGAAGPPPVPGAFAGVPAPVPAASSLYPCVKYHAERNIAPCAVPMCIAVRDPCACKTGCSCQPAQCVLVQICVPPCGCSKVLCKHDGTRVRYDYGKYAVDVTSHHGVVDVRYHD